MVLLMPAMLLSGMMVFSDFVVECVACRVLFAAHVCAAVTAEYASTNPKPYLMEWLSPAAFVVQVRSLTSIFVDVFARMSCTQYRENKKIDLIEEDYENGKNVRQFWQNKTLALLDDNTNEYIRSVIITSSKEIIDGMYDVSLIASCIQAKSRDEQQQILNDIKLNLNSKAVLEVNDKHLWGTDSNICVIKSVYIDRVSSSIVECVVDGNLYSWWSGLKIELGKYTSLRGKVKQITTDKDTGQIVTKLNYVKIAK